MGKVTVLLCAALFLALPAVAQNEAAAERFWPTWRGPTGNGVAPHGDPPTEWSETENIRWKVRIPGYGHATPIVWGDHVYVQTAVAPESGDGPYRFDLIALKRKDGAITWRKTLCESEPHEKLHRDASQASNSPVTDGEHIYAYFGSRGLFCVDMKGKVVWKRDFGQMQTRREFGEGSSPALWGDVIVIAWDHEGPSFIVALDKRTGEELWRKERDEPTAWSTPRVVTVKGVPQVVASAANRIRSYALKTGELLWECDGMTLNVVPTPLADERCVYCASGFRGNALLAIDYTKARGEITESNAVVWSYDGKGAPYVPSACLYDGKIYFLQTNRAVLSCVDAKTGKPYYARERLEGLGGVYASIVAADDRVYVVDRDGVTAVIAHGSELRVLATNTLDEGCAASPVIVDGELYLRGSEHLYCIAAP